MKTQKRKMATTRDQFRREWLRVHSIYEKRMLAILQNGFRGVVAGIPFNNITENTFELTIRLNANTEPVRDAFLRGYLSIGEQHGKRVGRDINRQIRAEQKVFTAASFVEEYRAIIQAWLGDRGFLRVTSVTGEFVNYLVNLFSIGIDQGSTIREIARAIENTANRRDFYRWQALRIATTETTAAANRAALTSMRNSNIAYEKIWISSNDARTRRRPKDKFDHIKMDGVTVEPDGFFNVQGDLLEYPGDPEGDPANIINCRCSVNYKAKRDSRGRLIFLD